MAQTTTYHGAYRSRSLQNGREMWTLTNDVALLATVPDEDVIWADDQEALVAQLNARHPAPHPLLTMLQTQHDGVAVFEIPTYNGGDPEEAYQLAKQCGRIKIDNRYENHTQAIFEAHPFLFKECRFLGNGGYYYDGLILVYDPKGVARRAAKSTKKATTAAISTHEVLRVVHAAYRQMWSSLEVKSLGAAATLTEACRYFTSRLAIFNMLYGKKAHRRWLPFQEFIKQWRLRAKNNGNKFEANDTLKQFAAWADKEARARLPEPTTEWVPLDLSFPA